MNQASSKVVARQAEMVGSDVTRIYGNTALTNGTAYTVHASFAGNSDWDHLTEAQQTRLKNELEAAVTVNTTDPTVNDTALTGNDTGRVTNNANGDYSWYVNYTADTGNFALANTDHKIIGGSDVNKTVYTIGLGEVSGTYGTKERGQYTIASHGMLINGDTGASAALDQSQVRDGALKADQSGTNPVGDYTWTIDREDITVSGVDDFAANYDIVVTDGISKITKAALTIQLGGGTHTYGSPHTGRYHLATGGITGLTNGDSADISVDQRTVFDTALRADDKKKTQDARTANYGWTAQLEGITDVMRNNYTITVNDGQSYVRKADLTVQTHNASTTYGTAFDATKYGYIADGLTNGDTDSILKNVAYDNKQAYDADGRVTGDAGTHAEDSLVSFDALDNYDVTIKAGDVTINRASISLRGDDVNIHTGETPTYSGTLPSVLVNGDGEEITEWNWALSDLVLATIAGKYEDSIHLTINGTTYQTAVDFTGGFWKNYQVSYDPGDLTVVADYDNWNDLFFDHPFDRMRNFRERKANIHFVDGAMTI